MTRNEFVKRFEVLVGDVQGVELSPSELIRKMEKAFLGFGKAFNEDFTLDTLIKLWTLVDESEDDFDTTFRGYLVTVNCINVGDKVKPVLITYARS